MKKFPPITPVIDPYLTNNLTQEYLKGVVCVPPQELLTQIVQLLCIEHNVIRVAQVDILTLSVANEGNL